MKNWKPDLRDLIVFGGLVVAATGAHFATWSVAVVGAGLFLLGLRVS